MQTTNLVYEGMCVLKVKVISLPYIFQVLYALCFTRPRYQVSVYRTIGPLVCSGRIRTLVLMATYIFHRLLMVKVEIDHFSSPEPKAHKVSL